ncbi:hypothetical protein PsSCT_00910 [Pseudomonas sp. SCT]
MPEQVGIRAFLGQLIQCDSVLGHRGFSGDGLVGKLNLAGNHGGRPLSRLTAFLAALSYTTWWDTIVQITEADLATWDYVPSRTQHAVSELKKTMLTGDFAGTQILNIERLNIQINLAGGNSQIEDTRSINLDQLNPSIAKTLRKHLNRSQ